MSPSERDRELFSSVDAAWLHMDTPSNLATITGVLSFDRRLDFERLKATLVYRLLVHRRFRQRIQEPVIGLGLPHWQLDDQFDFKYHLIPIHLMKMTPSTSSSATAEEKKVDTKEAIRKEI
jgi:hypothetical protein